MSTPELGEKFLEADEGTVGRRAGADDLDEAHRQLTADFRNRIQSNDPPEVEPGDDAALEPPPGYEDASAWESLSAESPDRPGDGSEEADQTATDSRGEARDETESIKDQQGTDGDFQLKEALGDLNAARAEIVIIVSVLDGLAEADKAVIAEVADELAALLRLVNAAMPLVEQGQAMPAGLVVSMTVRVELAQEAARDAATQADGQLRGILEDVLRRLGRAGRKLLSMNLHLFPVKEWSLAGEVSALFVKGSISVTFGQ